MADKEFDDSLIFTTQKFGDITIKQLSFGELGLISQDISDLYDKIVAKFNTPSTGYSQHDIVKGILLIMPEVAPIIAKVCNVPLTTINDLSASEGVRLCSAFWQMNQDIITNFFGIASSLKLAEKG